MQKTKRRRALGSYYTPEWLARWMVTRSFAAGGDGLTAWRILDPACGDGAFVIPILNELAAQQDVAGDDLAGRLRIVRGRVFGVDADPVAITTLHRRLAEWISGPLGSSNDAENATHSSEVADVLLDQFRLGDSLLGESWATPSSSASSTKYTVLSTENSQGNEGRSSEPIDWPTAFPAVAAAGGFDLVIGNPPYRRELNAKSDFDRIGASSIGQQWRTARMDLWHYFFHRGLDLLKPGGRLAYIVNSYWTSAALAKRLRCRMATECTMEEVVHFGAIPLFHQVTGRHMIFRVRKDPAANTGCQVFDLATRSRDQIKAEMQSGDWPADAMRIVSQEQLWQNGELRTGGVSAEPSLLSSPVLADQFEVRQGMAENPPFVTRAAALELGPYVTAGQGVFVLTQAEVAHLDLSREEAALLRPYYALSAVRRFHVDAAPSHQVLYLTKSTASSLERYPRIAAHLERYRTVLERRREVRSGQIGWWHLHWPREVRLFNEPRVLCLQMGQQPRFAYAEKPTYVGFSINLVVAKAAQPNPKFPVAALAAILNSPRAKRWFEGNAKPRGAHLDISGTVLKQFPLPSAPLHEILTELARMACQWPVDVHEQAIAERRLNELVEQLYSD